LTERAREHKQGEQKREREKQVPPLSRERVEGLWDHDPSRMQTINHLSHPDAEDAVLKTQVPSAAKKGQPGEKASFSLSCASSDLPNLSKNDALLSQGRCGGSVG